MAQPVLRKIFQKSFSGKDTEIAKKGIVLSLPLTIGICLVLVCAIGWAYFMGLMVGRGQNPEARLQEMTAFINSPKNNSTNIAESQEANSQPAPGEVSQPATAESLPTEHEVAQIQTSSMQPSSSAYPFNKPSAAGAAAWGKTASENVPAQSIKSPDKAKAAITSVPGEKILYDYVFQVGAFKSLKDAENLKKALESHKLKAKVQKSGKVCIVLVSVRGSETAATELASRIRPLKLGKPLQLSKKQVTPKTRKGR